MDMQSDVMRYRARTLFVDSLHAYLLFFLTMKRASVLLCVFFFFLSPQVSAFDVAGLQPLAPYGVFSTFGAESLPKNKVSFEIGAERSREPDFYRFMLKSSYGLSDNLELNVSVPYVYRFSDTIDGFEDLSLGFKHRFYEEGKYGPSLAYILFASLPSGREEFSTDGRVGIGLILSKRLGPFNGHFNVFYVKPGEGDLNDAISFASGFEFSATHNSEILGEFIALKSFFSNEYDQVETRLGYRIRTTENIYTTVGAGVDWKNRAPEYRLLLAITFTNAQGKKKVQKILEEEH
jgi:hypothetical protein